MSFSSRRRTTAGLPRLALVVTTVFGVIFVARPSAGASVQVPVDLGSAAPFGVLGDAVTNTGLTTIDGDLGVSPGGAVTGFPPGTVNGTIHVGGPTVSSAQAALSTAYDDAVARTADTNLTGQNLGGLTLTPGVYKFEAAAALTGTVTLDGLNDPNAVFIFQIGSSLGTAVAATVNLVNGARACNTVWQVGSAASLGTDTSFRGNVLASTAITVGAQSTLDGRLLTRAGTVTVESLLLTTGSCGTLGITSPLVADFGARGIAGAAQTASAALDAFSVSDARTSGAGWHVTAQASTFTGATHVLAAGSLSMSAPVVTASGTTSAPPIVTVGPYIIDTGAVSVGSASVGTGMGTYDFAATTLTLSLPPDVYADVYTSTVTISVVNAP